MSCSAVPSTVWPIFLSFSSCFTAPSFENFVALLTGWILCQGRHTVSRVIQAAGDAGRQKGHDAFYRFFSRARWDHDSLGRVLFRLFLPFLPRVITAPVDDTLAHKSGPHFWGASMHHDAGRSTYGRGSAGGRKVAFAFGHNWVILSIWVPKPWNPIRGFAIPILFRLYRSKKQCEKPAKKQPKQKALKKAARKKAKKAARKKARKRAQEQAKKEYRKRTELAVELIEKLASWIPEGRILQVVGDREYACQTVVRNLPKGVLFVGSMHMEAALYAQPKPRKGKVKGRPRLKGERLPSPTELAEDASIPWEEATVRIYGKEVTLNVKSMACLWYTVAHTKLVRMVLVRDPRGRFEDRAYFCTDHERSVEGILVPFSRRWAIEVAFRDGKQLMGVENPQNGWWRRRRGSRAPKKRPGPNPSGNRGRKAVERTLPFAFTAYAVVILWYLKHGQPSKDVERAKAEAPWYSHKKAPSFADMLAAMRRAIWAARFSANPLFDGSPEEIEELLPQWLLAS